MPPDSGALAGKQSAAARLVRGSKGAPAFDPRVLGTVNGSGISVEPRSIRPLRCAIPCCMYRERARAYYSTESKKNLVVVARRFFLPAYDSKPRLALVLNSRLLYAPKRN